MPVEFIAATIFHIDTDTAVFQLLLFTVSGIVVPAPGAFDQTAEYIWSIAAMTHLCSGYLTGEFKLIRSDVWLAVVFIIAVNATIGLILEKPVNLVRRWSIITVFTIQIGNGVSDRIAGKIMLVGIVDDVRHRLVLYEPVIDNLIAIACASAGHDFADRALIIQNRLDSLGGPVTLRLIDREHDVDHHLAVGGRRVVVLKDCFPIAVMRLQNLLCDVVVFDITKPAIELGHEDHIDLVLFDIF